MARGRDPFDQGMEEGALAALKTLYERVDRAVQVRNPTCEQDGGCCRFKTSGLRLFATRLEAEYLIKKSGPIPQPMVKVECPFLKESLCTARAGRTLGCRLYFCHEETGEALSSLYEAFHEEIIGIHHRFSLPYTYQELLCFFKSP